MSVEDLKDVSAARLWRRVKVEIGVTCDEAADRSAIALLESFRAWSIHAVMRKNLEERRAADPPKPKPVQCDFC